MLERKAASMLERLIKIIRNYEPEKFCCYKDAPPCGLCNEIDKAKKLIKRLRAG